MKIKYLVFSFITFIVISCKKDYTCQCTTLYGNSISTIHNTKKKAQKECSEKPTFNNSQESNCKIK
jgi:hypothetical protein